MSDASTPTGAAPRVQPMVHVEDMAQALAFYEALGATIVFGSRDGDWTLLDFAGSRLALLAHPPGDGLFERVELQFVCPAGALEAIAAAVEARSRDAVVRGVADEAFGRLLALETPDGLRVKVIELERDVIE